MLRSLESFRGEAERSTYLYCIVINECYRYIRKNIRERQERLPQDLKSTDDDPLQLLEKSDMNTHVGNCIKQLAEQHAACLNLRIHGQKSYAEIAAALNLSVDQVTANIGRGREDLRDLMKRKGLMP
jgi:RNA polymerase sigma factor (sigma-70 family)